MRKYRNEGIQQGVSIDSGGQFVNLRSFFLGMLIGCISACSGQNPQSESEAPWLNTRTIEDELFFSFIQRANDIASAQGYNHAEVAQGAFIAVQAPFEYWQWIAVLFDAKGNAYALQQRFVRVRISSSAAKADDSQWQFSEVVATDYQLNIQNKKGPETHKQAQRVALDLAGADSAIQAIWVGAYRATAESEASINELQNCNRSYELTMPKLNALFNSAICPEIENTNAFSVSSGAAMPVHGTYKLDSGVVNLSGHGWFMHGWGVPPVMNNSAVLIDRAWLMLNDRQDLQMLRTRRRSGRGPSLTSGSLRAVGSVSDNIEVNPQWRLDTDTNSSNESDIHSRDGTDVQIDEQNNEPPMSLTLVPFVQHTSIDQGPPTSLFNAGALPRLQAVLVEGSHAGAGFVELQPSVK